MFDIKLYYYSDLHILAVFVNKIIPHLDFNCMVLGGLVLSLPAKLLCGGLAGAIAQSFSYPMDVTRRRMQLAMMKPETKIYA